MGVVEGYSDAGRRGPRRDGPAPGSKRAKHDRAFGQWGEDTACRHLEQLGWRIVERNWRCDLGELDIVALEPAPTGDVLVFVEVKARAGTGFGRPLEAITWAKQRRLRELASRWLTVHDHRALDSRFDSIRIDAVGVLRAPDGPVVEHVRNVS